MIHRSYEKFILKIFIFPLIILCHFSSRAGYPENRDPVFFRNFTISDGLPNYHVNRIAQDRNGFLWIATWDGLSRFDGYEFRNFHHIPKDSTSLPYFIANDLAVDRYDNIWVKGSFYYLSRFVKCNETFQQFQIPLIKDLALDSARNLWIACAGCILKWDELNNRFDKYSYKKTDSVRLSKLNIHHLCFDNLNNPSISFYVSGGQDSILTVSLTSDNRINLKFLGKFRFDNNFLIKFSSDFQYNILVTRSGKSWMISNLGNFLLDERTHEFKKYKGLIPDSELDGLNSRRKSSYIHSQKWFSQDQHNFDPTLYPTFQFTESTLMDNAGTDWLVLKSTNTEGTGISRCIRTPDWFKHYFTKNEKNRPEDIFFTVVKDRFGTLWTAPKNGGVLLNNRNDHVYRKTFPYNELIDRIGSYPRCMLTDSNGRFMKRTPLPSTGETTIFRSPLPVLISGIPRR